MIAGGYNDNDAYTMMYSTDPREGWSYVKGDVPFGKYGECLCIAYGDGLWVAGGVDDNYEGNYGGRTIWYTTNPASGWKVSGNGPFGYNSGNSRCNGIAYGDGQWVAVGYNPNNNYKTLYSLNPENGWDYNGTTFDNGEGYDVKYANNLWVAVGYNYYDDSIQDSIYYSTNPSGGWTEAPNSGYYNLYKVAYGNGKWLVIDAEDVLYSTDPRLGDWNRFSLDFTAANGLAYGEGMWVVVGREINDGETIVHFADPTDEEWQGIPDAPLSNNFDFGSIGRGVAYGNGLWVAVGQANNQENTIYYTQNPKLGWNRSPGELFGSDGYGRGRGVAYGGGLWVAVGDDYDGAKQILCTSNPTNGWTKSPGVLFGDGDGNTVAYGDGLWVAGGHEYDGETDRYKILYSSDPAIGWTASPGTLANIPGNINGIAYANGLWVAVGYDNEYDPETYNYIGVKNILYSTNPAKGWNLSPGRLFGAGKEGYAVTYSNGLWVAVGYGYDSESDTEHSILYSTNPAKGWTGINTYEFGCRFRSVVYTGKSWVVGDSCGKLYFTLDITSGKFYGIETQNGYETFYDGDAYGLASANGLTIAVGYDDDTNLNVAITEDL